MTLANPIYLWSLLGLAVPIAIHFLSRKEGKVIKLGSIRHVQETSTQQFRGIRLNEIFLLMLRCLLILILALMLSGLYFNQENGKWILVESGVEKNKNVSIAIDSLELQGYESHWLTKSFPSTSASPDSSELNYWSLFRELERQNLEEAIVFSFLKEKNFKGEQQTIPANVKVIPVESGEKKFLLEAVQENDSVSLRRGVSNSSFTSFETKKVKTAGPSIHATRPHQVRILLVSDKAHSRERQILLAAIRAIDQISSSSFLVVEKNANQFSATDTSTWIFWMSDVKAPQTKSNILKYNPQISNDLIEQSKRNEWELTHALNEEIALEKNLNFSLASLLTFNSRLEKIASGNDQRALPEKMAFKSIDEMTFAALTPPTSSPLFLIVFFAALFVCERYLAYRKNQ